MYSSGIASKAKRDRISTTLEEQIDIVFLLLASNILSHIRSSHEYYNFLNANSALQLHQLYKYNK